MKKTNTDHIVIRNSNLLDTNSTLLCTNCGGKDVITYPISIAAFNIKVEAFIKLHKKCPKTWTEPEIDQTQSVQEKAMFWLNNGHVGMSSKTMWNFFMGNKDYPINHPHDPDDFSRCYKLLKAVPEWEIRVPELASLSKEWKNLSQNWQKLAEMYEENKRTEFKEWERVGMGKFMDELLKVK
jgi:hypothetical protein